MATITSINPYTGEVNASYETLTDEQIVAKIETAHTAFLNWKNTTFAEKKELFYKLAEVIESGMEASAKLQTIEMGMLIGPSINGLKSTIKLIKWFADNAESLI